MKRKSSSVTPPIEDRNEKPSFLKRKENETTSKSGFFSSSKRILTLCLVFRMVNSLLVQTYFNPDEHWQALEVAHHITFGYGHLTWEWSKGIRSYLHPMMFVPLYKFLALLGLDTPWFMIRAPRLLQSVFSSVGDFYLYKLAHRIFGERVAQWTLFSQLVNWFTFFCFTRTLSNNLETVLTLIGLYYWPSFRHSSKHVHLASRKRGLVLAALACALRPTSAITWLYVGLLELFETKDPGIFQSKQWKLFGLMAWVLGLYSVLGHKEFRFVMPVLPIALMFSGYSLAAMEDTDSKEIIRKTSPNLQNKCPSRMQFGLLFLLVTNLPMALYMSLVHQRGSEDAMNFLSHEALEDRVKSVLFLAPCHATPYYSTLHRNLPMRFLDCSPSENREIPDESDLFMMDPVGFVSDMAKDWVVPSHIVLFDSQEKQLKEFLISHSFRELKRFFHAHFKVDRELQGSIVVYSLTSQ
ncbi:hypothetical protein MKW94_012140 [Papaver nudicaule]|uniref:Mannosyltransferase n=1 Tax=Papaver nudicaule TaxID=74823 RepID=A0AA41W1X4_PAPNU|nr:hypothetical protein [Papaver nudicaule]